MASAGTCGLTLGNKKDLEEHWNKPGAWQAGQGSISLSLLPAGSISELKSSLAFLKMIDEESDLLWKHKKVRKFIHGLGDASQWFTHVHLLSLEEVTHPLGHAFWENWHKMIELNTVVSKTPPTLHPCIHPSLRSLVSR